MGIIADKTFHFHLFTEETSYLMEVSGSGDLVHTYWGKRIHSPPQGAWFNPVEVASFSPNPYASDKRISYDTMPREFPDFGRSDYSSSAIEITDPESGSHIVNPIFKSYTIVPAKPPLSGLPAVYTENDSDAQTLIITLKDEKLNLEFYLYYTVFSDFNVITRHTAVRNFSKHSIRIEKILSCTIDFLSDANFEMLHLHGAYSRECRPARISLGSCSHRVESRRGASSHEQNPFIALVRPETNQFSGEVYSMSLIYSGSFLAEVSVNCYEKTRMQIGLHPDDFSWELKSGELFTAPEAVLVFSESGINGMSAKYHSLYKNRLCRGPWKHAPRPILINNWEATYFDFDENKIIQLMDAGAELGAELFVLDDGWFGERNSDAVSLGDWTVNTEKLPHGLRDLSDHAHERGLLFGLWMEPEMISPGSRLYAEHPDWCLHAPGRHRSLGRNQLVIDLSRKTVENYLFDTISAIIKENGVDYIKWDMNRNITEAGSTAYSCNQQGEISHRYILGLYSLLDRLTRAFPEVLFESCAGGGGRFDPGMLFYTPQIWTSDATDAHERLKIQWGTSFIYPQLVMGAHVSAIPNHQIHRAASLDTRVRMSMSANFGIELDVTKLTVEEKEKIAHESEVYKEHRLLFQYGQLYRIEDPFVSDRGVWIIISEDLKTAAVFCFQQLAVPNSLEKRVRLRYLDPDSEYLLSDGKRYYGDTLMNYGLEIPKMESDFDSVIFLLKRADG